MTRLRRRSGYGSRDRFLRDFEKHFRILPADVARLQS
jgi:hypothetical protein